MPLQNRVTPFNTLEAVPSRSGMLTGNRGILHDANKRVGKSTWKNKRWICCVLQFEDYRRKLMVPGEYTHLFFLDEAVSFAAGHRPCKACRKDDYKRFVIAWKAANAVASEDSVKADDIDAALHVSRITASRGQACFTRQVADLPDGAIFTLPDQPNEAWLLWRSAIHRWSHEGYLERRPRPDLVEVTVLTPHRTIATLAAGYVPAVHPSVT